MCPSRANAGCTAPGSSDPRRGNPREAIPGLARELKADLVVMGTVARTGIAGFIIGNTVESILDDIGCSELAVKPDGFVSPVAPDD